MAFARPDARTRIIAASAAIALQALFAWVLISGLSVTFAEKLSESLNVFDIAPEPDPPPPVTIEPNPVADTRPEGEAAPPNLRSRATEIEAPVPIVQIPLPPPPVITAPVAAVGNDASSGNADIPGPGTGAGGIGDGTGSGGRGDGDGAGGRETPPRQIGGRLSDRDFPRAAANAGAGGTVEIIFNVEADGRITDCGIERSSGNRELDQTTCRLVVQRYRYQPARDARGRPVPSTIIESHEWVNRVVPAEPGE